MIKGVGDLKNKVPEETSSQTVPGAIEQPAVRLPMSADDFEFFTSHIDADNYVIYDGPVPEDSQKWAAGRIANSFKAFKDAGLPAPTIFEFPHYAGSYADYQAAKASFTTGFIGERSWIFRPCASTSRRYSSGASSASMAKSYAALSPS